MKGSNEFFFFPFVSSGLKSVSVERVSHNFLLNRLVGVQMNAIRLGYKLNGVCFSSKSD